MFLPSIMLPRPHVTEKLRQAVEKYPLTVIAAPIGYGKTTLARAIVDSIEGGVYYAVPTGPHDASFLWHDMFSRMEAQGVAIAPAMLRLGFPVAASQWRQALELLQTLSTPICLILDDCHHNTDAALFVFWERVVRAELPNVRLVLFSRTRPEISLEELRIKEYAVVFEQDLLAFSEAETRKFFQLHGVNEFAAANEAQQYSEGWAAALWLCLQSWLVSGRILESHDINSLLAAFFATYSGEEQDVLLRLSVLEDFTGEDAYNIVLPLQHNVGNISHSAVNLRALREKNPFLTFDAKSGRYQFHAIFKDFLRKEFDMATHIDKAALYRLAGESCLERRDLVAAIRLFSRAGRDEDLIRLLDIFLLPEYDERMAFFHEEMFAVTNAIPWSVRMQNPLGYLGFVTVCLLSWNDSRSAALLEEVAERFAHVADLPEYMQKRLKGELEVLWGVVAFNDLWTVGRHYEKAYRLLCEPSIVVSKGTAWNLGSPSLSFLYLRDQGRYGDIVELLEKNWSLYRKLSGGLGRAGGKMFRAEYLAERGEFAEAARLAREVLQVCRGDRHFASALAASFCLARLAVFTGNAEEATAFLEALRPQVERMGLTDHLEGFDLAVGYINVNVARQKAVPVWLRNGEIYDPPHSAVPPVLGLSQIVYCKALMLQEEYAQITAIAEDIPIAAAPLKCLFAEIHSKVLMSVAAWHTQGRSTALKLLNDAVELSRPDGIVLPLAEYGGHIVPVLRALKRTLPKDAHLDLVLALARRMALVSGSSRKEKNVLLTRRETEIMRHVTNGESNPEIARQLGISVNTVKDLLSRAYEKLRVSGRTEAAQRFIELYGNKQQET